MNSFEEHLNFPSSPEVMDFPPQSPTNSIPLWRPGSSSYPISKPVLDPVSSKAEMNKFYQSMAESDYDLSLRDLVDPTFSIDGEAIITSKSSSSRDAVGGDEDSGQKKGEWRRRRRKLYISALFLGSLNRLVGSQREKVVNGEIALSNGNLQESKQIASPLATGAGGGFPQLIKPSTLLQPDLNYHPHQKPVGPRIHPSNQCSHCSSYTVFFRTQCTVCGKLYCCNCVMGAMDTTPTGSKCKGTCASHPIGRSFVEKARRGCMRRYICGM